MPELERHLFVDPGVLAELNKDDPADLVWLVSEAPDPHLTLQISAAEWVRLGRPEVVTVTLDCG